MIILNIFLNFNNFILKTPKKEMGFSKSQSEVAIKNHGSVQTALESICMYNKTDKCKLRKKKKKFMTLL